MDRQNVSSSNVKSVGYDPEKQFLEVEFAGGGIYQYEGVSPDAHKEVMAAKSIGSHIHAHIKPKRKFKKL